MVPLSSIIDEIADIAGSLGALGEERTRVITETHTPTTASRLAVATRNGAIHLHPTDGDELTVDAVASTRHRDDDLDAVTIHIHQNSKASEDVDEKGEEISVSVEVPKDAKNISVSLDIGVPASLAVERAVTKNGKIEARDVDGDARFETRNGKIVVEHVRGTVSAVTKNGKVTVRDTPIREVTSKNGKHTLELPTLTADASVETKNGKITIGVPKDLDANYRLETTRGRATVDGLTTLVDSSSKTQVSGELGTGGPLLDASTKNGKVTLRALDD